jgi:hypothetical protein
MPWKPKDATRFTKKATTPELRRQWADVANNALKRGLSDGDAVKEANSVIKHQK